MAARKMTFAIPEDVARKFVRQVPARERSKYLAQVLARSLAHEEAALIRACRLANKEKDVRRIEQEWDAMQDRIEEQWNDSAPR